GNQGGDGGGGGNQGVQVQLVGDSSSMLQEIGQEVVPLLAQRAELRDVRIDNGEKGGELKVRVDRERAAAFGFNAEQVASFVGLALRG
ncbi:efflux RND transporter permease subunit, partial [Escherichia coli]|uniref:efflux RND transporter permease subunit n=5 Tax=Gammaproteobacteria TaxID=1236 RepID=UPI003B9FBD02